MSGSFSLLSDSELQDACRLFGEWILLKDPPALTRTITFRNFPETMAFVNTVAWIAHDMDHHPDFQVGYKTCTLVYTTHSAGGITSLDLEAVRRVNGFFTS